MQGRPKRSDFWAKLEYRDDDRSTGEIVERKRDHRFAEHESPLHNTWNDAPRP